MINGISGYISRTTSWWNIGADWTKSFYVRLDNTPPVGSITLWGYGDITYAAPYIWVGGGNGTTNVLLEVFDGVSFLDTATVSLTGGTNFYLTIRYTAATHLLELITNGSTVVGSVTVDLSAIVFTADLEWMVGDTPSVGVDINRIGYERLYQRTQTLAELVTEMASITPVSLVSLLSSCPLQASSDLTDHVGTYLAVFMASAGTITTNTTDPLLSVIAGPPTNTSPATATPLTADSAVFQDVDGGAGAVNVFYSYTAADVKVLSLIATRGATGTYLPSVEVASSLANAIGGIFDIGSPTRRGIQWGTVAGTTYYFRVSQHGVVSPALAIISLLVGLDLAVPLGSYVINDDTLPEPAEPTPLVFLDHTTGYPIDFIPNFPRGEGGQILDNGRLLVTNEALGDGDGVTSLYEDNGQTFIASIDLLPFVTTGSTHRYIASNRTDTFLVAYEIDNDHIRLVTVSDACVILGQFDLSTPNVFLTALGVTPDFTRAYLALTDSSNRPIKCVDLSAGAFLADLNAGVANYNAGRDILCISSEVILVPYWRQSGGINSVIVRKYDSAGTVLETHNFDAFTGPTGDILDIRLCRWLDDNSYIIWVKGPTQGHDYVVRAATAGGAVLEATPNLQEYESYQQLGAITDTPVRFGHSESCAIWTVRTSGPPPPTPLPPGCPAGMPLLPVIGRPGCADTV
jgi:hypothetical protein